VEGTSASMRASLDALQQREAELAAQLGNVNAKLSEAQAASHSAEKAREETAMETEAAALALAKEADAKAGLTLQLAQATAELAHSQAVRKERSATLAALETQLASAEADSKSKADALRQLKELHESTLRDSMDAAERQRTALQSELQTLSLEHQRQVGELSADKANLATRHATLVDSFDVGNARRDAEAARLTAEKAALVELRAATEAQSAVFAEGLQRDLLAERALRLEAEGRAEDAAREAAADLSGLREQHGRDANVAAESSASLREQLLMLRAAYDSLFASTMGEQAGRQEAEARADEHAVGLRTAEAIRLKAEAEFTERLRHKEARLLELAEAGSEKELQLRDSLARHSDASAQLAELYVRAAAAERRARQLERRLRDIDEELTSVGMRGRLLADELRLLEAKAAMDSDSLLAEEKRRLRELRTLVAERDGVETTLQAERGRINAECEELRLTLEVLAGERAADAQRYTQARAAADVRLSATVAEHEATVSSLESQLRRNAEERQRALANMEAESRSFELAILRKEAELASMRGDLHATRQAELRTRLLAGVSAVKHGRKGAPHRRHVRCSRDLQRLEWSKAGEAASSSVGAHEVLEIHTRGPAKRLGFFAPLASLPESLNRLAATGGGEGAGGGGYFASLRTSTRSVDLEFG